MLKPEQSGLYGLIAEFDDPNTAVAAARRTYEEGYRRINAYSPYPIEELSEAIGYHRNFVPLAVLICGVLGGLGGFALQSWASAIEYPINVGGRPLISIPAFIPITFECVILMASIGAFIGMLLMNGLPRPYHPVFNVPAFSRATQDRFFVCVKADDPKFSENQTRAFLLSLGAKEVSNVDE
jgi:hypothetical protein